jgi:hypothetical protein
LVAGPVGLLALKVLVGVAEVPNHRDLFGQRLRLGTDLGPIPMEVLLEAVPKLVLDNVLGLIHDPHETGDLVEERVDASGLLEGVPLVDVVLTPRPTSVRVPQRGLEVVSSNLP